MAVLWGIRKIRLMWIEKERIIGLIKGTFRKKSPFQLGCLMGVEPTTT